LVSLQIHTIFPYKRQSIQNTMIKFIDKESQSKIIKPYKFDAGLVGTTANLCNCETLKFLKFKLEDLDSVMFK
jgi:hypothetical protein